MFQFGLFLTSLFCVFSQGLIGAFVFQPQFKWADQTCTQQGTGSFIRAPDGRVIGLTSAHFINFSGPQLLEVEWLDVKTGKSIATSKKSWGMPGREGSYNPVDLRSDYLLFLMEGNICAQSILEMDNRSKLEIGERVWFPNKNAEACFGQDLIEGTISKVSPAYLVVTLDSAVDLQSRSGTPIISQHTGKVIGILTAGEVNGKNTLLYITPGITIYRALLETQHCFLLKDVIGKPSNFLKT